MREVRVPRHIRRKELKKQRKQVTYVCVNCGAVQNPVPTIDPLTGELWFQEPMKDYKRCRICHGSLRREVKKSRKTKDY